MRGNSKLHLKIEKFESHVSGLETHLRKQVQYNRRNNLDIKGVPDSISDDKLKENVLEILDQIDVKIKVNDTEDCHCMGKSNKVIIICLVSRKNSSLMLGSL